MINLQLNHKQIINFSKNSTRCTWSGTYFYAVAFRKKIYNNLDELQADLDNWIRYYNEERTHSGKYCFGKTPMETFLDTLQLAKEKKLDDSLQTTIEQNDTVCQMK
jgi:hypothetical protein